MSTFDDAFDADRKLSRSGCVCGQHGSAAEHDQAALTLRCEPAPTRATALRGGGGFRRDARDVSEGCRARALFLKSVGAPPRPPRSRRFFPIATATDVFAQARPAGKDKLKVGFIPITCATPIIMAHPLGFYAK